jgi:hypothetical protein
MLFKKHCSEAFSKGLYHFKDRFVNLKVSGGASLGQMPLLYCPR